MIGLIISDTHILYGNWTSAKDKYSLEDLKYIQFSKPLKELIKTQKELHSVIESALEGIELKGKEVIIAIDDDMLFHDKFATDESISNKEIWDYIQWETKQKWGELGNYYITFAEKDSLTTSVLHCVTAPTLLISEIKGIVSNKSGNPVWSGPVSAIYLENKEIANAVYMLDDDLFIRFYFRGRDGYSEGKLRFVGGQPTISVVVGDKEEQTKLFNVKNDVFKFVTIDLISENKNSNLRQYRPQRMIPFEGVDVKVEDIPEDVSFKLLNVLSILIKDFSYKYLINFFNPTQIQEKHYEGLGEIGFNEDGERIEESAKLKKDEKQVIKKEKSNIKEEKKVKKEKNLSQVKEKEKTDKEDKKKHSLLPYLLIILLAAAGYYFFYTDAGKDLLLKAKEAFGISKTSDNSETVMLFDTYLNQSDALLNGYINLTSVVSPDSIISLELSGNNGRIEFVGTDSMDIANINSTNYIIEPIECCGGIKQYIEFNIGYIAGVKNNIWADANDVIDQLKNTFQIDQIRVLEDIADKDMVYKPIIFQINSIDLLDKIIKYLEYIGDNVIVRKITITNDIPENNINATFYISVFEPL